MRSDERFGHEHCEGKPTVLLVELDVVEGTSDEDTEVEVGASVVVGTGAELDVDVGSEPPVAADVN
jgi:hypothetical protein